MNYISFQVTIDPRALRTISAAGNEISNKMSNEFIARSSQTLVRLARKYAPKRTGKLRAGIEVTFKEKLGGGYDRRAKVRVTSTAAHSRYVIGGVRSRIGDGTPGTGRYVGAKGFFRRGSKNYKGTGGFRSGFGKYPGFEGNDFMERAAEDTQRTLLDKFGVEAIVIHKATYRKLGLMYG